MRDGVEEKQAMRRVMRDRCRSRSAAASLQGSTDLCLALADLPTVQAATSIMLYLPIAGEIDVLPLAAVLLDRDVAVSVPFVDWDAGTMIAVRITSLAAETFDQGPHGVRTPRLIAPVASDDLNLVIVPGLAFDGQGGRLGRGAGFYDRFLAGRVAGCMAIGAAFNDQVVPSVPMEAHDERLDLVCTDQRVLVPGTGAG